MVQINLRMSLLIFGVLLFAYTNSAHAHDEHCAAIKASVDDAGFSNKVKVDCTADSAVIQSDTYPEHELMTGIVGTNEQVPVPAEYAAPIPLSPELLGEPQTRDAALGVAINGVPIYDYTAGGEMSQEDLYHHQARHDTLITQQLDNCGGHAGRGDDYHYHKSPSCMIAQMKNAGPAAIIGWAFDGFPIYGDKNPDGTDIATLDVCNGQADPAFGYRYHTSAQPPYIIQCLMGEVASLKSLPRVRPLGAADGGPGAASGRPPKGGVQDLVFMEDDDGKRRMDYTYNGEAYFIEYSPTEKPLCFQFETRTITNNGVAHSGEYCR